MWTCCLYMPIPQLGNWSEVLLQYLSVRHWNQCCSPCYSVPKNCCSPHDPLHCLDEGWRNSRSCKGLHKGPSRWSLRGLKHPGHVCNASGWWLIAIYLDTHHELSTIKNARPLGCGPQTNVDIQHPPAFHCVSHSIVDWNWNYHRTSKHGVIIKSSLTYLYVS